MNKLSASHVWFTHNFWWFYFHFIKPDKSSFFIWFFDSLVFIVKMRCRKTPSMKFIQLFGESSRKSTHTHTHKKMSAKFALIFAITSSPYIQPSDVRDCFGDGKLDFVHEYTLRYPVRCVYIRDDVKCTTELENHAVQSVRFAEKHTHTHTNTHHRKKKEGKKK